MKQAEFAEGKMWPLLWKMALPSIAAQVVNMLYGIVDRIYLGHIEGEGTLALAGIGVANTLIILLSAFAQIVGGGDAPLTSIALGQGDQEKAKKLFGNGVFLLLVFSLILTLVSYLALDPLLRLIGASDSTLPYAHDYLSIYLIGTIFVELTIGLNPFVNVLGHPLIAMVSVILGAVLNIALDPLFIFVFSMGIKGAAIATVIAQFASALWTVLFFCRKKQLLRFSFQAMKPEWRMMKKIFALGAAPFVMASTEAIIGLVMNGGLAKYGDLYVSCLTVMQSCMMIVSVPLTGFSNGVSPVISYNYGQKNAKRVKEAFRDVFLFMSLLNMAEFLLMILFPEFFAKIFTSDPELIALVGRTMPFFFLGMLLFGMQRACQTMFVALDEPRLSLLVALLRKVIVLVPLALILPHFMGVNGVYAAEPIADGSVAVLCVLIFFLRYRKTLFSKGGPRFNA